MKEDVKQPTAPSSTMDINRELAPHRWNLVRERAQISLDLVPKGGTLNSPVSAQRKVDRHALFFPSTYLFSLTFRDETHLWQLEFVSQDVLLGN